MADENTIDSDKPSTQNANDTEQNQTVATDATQADATQADATQANTVSDGDDNLQQQNNDYTPADLGADLPDDNSQLKDDGFQKNEDGYYEGEDNDPLADYVPSSGRDLEPVYDIPVSVSAVLGKTSIPVSSLLRLKSGQIIELDRKVGEAIDIYVNDRLVARGEVVMMDNSLGISMTEIIKTEEHE